MTEVNGTGVWESLGWGRCGGGLDVGLGGSGEGWGRGNGQRMCGVKMVVKVSACVNQEPGVRELFRVIQNKRKEFGEKWR